MVHQHRHEGIYSRIFATLYDPILSLPEREFLYGRREELLSDMHGRVMDVGTGTGLNFVHFPDRCSVLAIEPSHAMLQYARQRLASAEIRARIEIVEAGIEDPMLTDAIPKESIDYAVCILVLCTIPNPLAALNRIRTWLKPTGKLIVLEHIRSRSTFAGKIQDLFNPVWRPFSEGCRLNRATDRTILEAGFQMENEKYYNFVMPIYEGRFGRGV
jgi:ubiquinone/menaquinone biosynthesis C-methylase UbiE